MAKKRKVKKTKKIKSSKIDFNGSLPPGVDPYWFRKERAKMNG